MWVYIFFSVSQVLLSSLSWCSACISVSEGVFLLYPWREMHPTSTYSSSILSYTSHISYSIEKKNSGKNFHMLLISANISTYTPTHSMSPLSLWVNCSGHFLSPFFKYWIPSPPHSTTSLLQSLYHRFSFLCST